jgi:hypothetical protein
MIIQVGGYEVVLNKKQLAICFAPRKYEIKEAIAELRRTKQLPGYKPNYGRITSIYIINTYFQMPSVYCSQPMRIQMPL